MIFIAFLVFDIVNTPGYSFNQALTYGGRDWWFIWTFIFLKLISPFLDLGIRSFNRYIVLLIGILFLIIYSLFLGTDYENAFGAGQLVMFIGLYLIGGVTAFSFKQILEYKYSGLIALCILIVLTFCIILSYTLGSSSDCNLLYSYSYPTSFISWITAYLLILITYKIKIKSNKITNYLSNIYLTIYLFHFIFELIMNHYVWSKIFLNGYQGNELFLAYPLGTITFIISLLFSLILGPLVDIMYKYSAKLFSYITTKIKSRYIKYKNIENKNLDAIKKEQSE